MAQLPPKAQMQQHGRRSTSWRKINSTAHKARYTDTAGQTRGNRVESGTNPGIESETTIHKPTCAMCLAQNKSGWRAKDVIAHLAYAGKRHDIYLLGLVLIFIFYNKKHIILTVV